MTQLQEYYKKHPTKMSWALDVAVKCQVSVNGVLKWVNGWNKPRDPRHIEILAAETGIAQDQLFEPSQNS